LTRKTIDTDELRYWLALLRTPRIGSRTFITLLEKVGGSPRELFDHSRQALSALGLRDLSIDAIKNADWQTVDHDLKWTEQPDHHLITLHDAAYPSLLKNIPDPPPLLFVHGSLAALRSHQLAIVGSRNPSTVGKTIAGQFAQTLVHCGLSITSGLALGIDAASHRGALAANGTTLAVAGTGPDKIYPATNKRLACEIIEHGALVTEFPPGTAAQAHHFPRRNRIISGMSVGTLVVEAAIHSGSLITARAALEQGREVFAIPGSIHNPLARGCNALIRQGAKLVETAQDILEEIGSLAAAAGAPVPAVDTRVQPEEELSEDYRNVLKEIAYAPTTVDTLVETTRQSAENLASMLLVLELRGYVASSDGGAYYRLK
jgi:DNA processing protein